MTAERNGSTVNGCGPRSSSGGSGAPGRALNDYARNLRDDLRRVAFLQEADKSLRTVRSVISYAMRSSSKGAGKRRRGRTGGWTTPPAVQRRPERSGGGPGPTPLWPASSRARPPGCHSAIRIAAYPKILEDPLEADSACARVRTWHARPNAMVVHPPRSTPSSGCC